MPKNKKTHDTDTTTVIQNKECFSRMNFLYQASMLMAGRNNTLATFYGQLCRSVGKKGVLRIDPEVNRNLCKRCSLPLKPSVTADLEVHKPHSSENKKRKNVASEDYNIDQDSQLQVVCRQCNYRKNFVVKEHTLWLDQPECVVEKLSIEAKISK